MCGTGGHAVREMMRIRVKYSRCQPASGGWGPSLTVATSPYSLIDSASVFLHGPRSSFHDPVKGVNFYDQPPGPHLQWSPAGWLSLIDDVPFVTCIILCHYMPSHLSQLYVHGLLYEWRICAGNPVTPACGLLGLGVSKHINLFHSPR